jgi:6-phosphogluconolactonase
LNRSVEIFPDTKELAEAIALTLVNQIREAEKYRSPVSIALSGGNTPKPLFSVLADRYSASINWAYVHFFWGDERCVPPCDPDSNYGTVSRMLLDKINIPDFNIHRIRGEDDPEIEAARYSLEIRNFTVSRNDMPVFDHIILGLGEDGHTASIFPGNTELLLSENVCDVVIHPVTGQKRITITCRVINNAYNITFIVSGQGKADVVSDILNDNNASCNYPAAYIIPDHGKLNWLIDQDAGRLLLRK